ncbi:hypothetical protein V9K24_001993 [Vibrio cholerae]|nr:hypothetical protein [Vibrio cholerae]EKF9246741.1 hypothetical protein [Vibrio cholerae]EKF9436965.1 hypothetical protein [Vibrio cholerae]GHZ01931.1 hypothetical protein VCSRO122_0884 [Vibrio cholerae]GHZ62217.1 hypothetical protein VCSRO175_1172 [Vibrio cholerae]
MWKHNAFGDIVKQDQDFIGHVAYSLYKDKKVKWIKNYKEKQGRFPTDDEIHDYFTSFHSSEENIKKFRDDAERMLNEYFLHSYAAELDSYKEELKNEAIIEKINKPLLVSIKESVIASLISAALIAIGSTAYWLNFEKTNMEKKLTAMETMQKELIDKLSLSAIPNQTSAQQTKNGG